ncbi:A-factor biosynthesis hotdog protein [Streptomyces sp. TLI_235]|nr:ScbA/BarX family gamma-butyrolactone biosynthesis protein [Streptomyces sp. TLI_235]PBC76725.1 A-factor biosynthesis hotdog protein [Streptomyces sp. TLI_235]
MTTAPLAPVETTRHPAEAVPLSYATTLDRGLVHRDAVSEVFVTDLRGEEDGHYSAAAQLPRSHAYYGDHLLRPGTHDPVLLLEAARQATLAGAHMFHGVPADHKFILTFLRIHLIRPQLLTIGDSPLDLVLKVTVTDRRTREGRVTGLDHRVDLTVDGTVIGWAGVGLRFRDPAGYREMRLRNRDGAELPSTAMLPPQTGGAGEPAVPAAPHLVGRADPRNVVLLDPVLADGAATAVLRIPAGNPSMFDHPQDHLPGMVLAEAARQLALFTALDTRGLSAAKTFPVDLSVTFARFGELEPQTVLTATLGEEKPLGAEAGEHAYYTQGGPLDLDEAEPGTAVTQLPVVVDARQQGESIARFVLSLARIRG